MTESFVKLNDGWNAQPNAPEPQVLFSEDALLLTFDLNAFQYPTFKEGQRATLRFTNCSRFRLGAPNDEGWYAEYYGDNTRAPWGDFYELSDPSIGNFDSDWRVGPAPSAPQPQRHFLFHLRDDTFECHAADWSIAFHTK